MIYANLLEIRCSDLFRLPKKSLNYSCLLAFDNSRIIVVICVGLNNQGMDQKLIAHFHLMASFTFYSLITEWNFIPIFVILRSLYLIIKSPKMSMKTDNGKISFRTIRPSEWNVRVKNYINHKTNKNHNI